MNDESLLDPRQVSKRLNVSRSTAMRLIVSGTIPAILLRSGKRKHIWRVSRQSLDRWIEVREKETQRAKKLVLIAS